MPSKYRHVFCVVLLALGLLPATGSARGLTDIGVRANVELADGEPANDILGFGVYGHYAWAQGWLLGVGLDQMSYDFESPARILKIIQPPGSVVVDAPATATNVAVWVERRYAAGARSAWYWQAGVGVGLVSADDVTGPVQGGGTYRITTDADTELLLLGGLGYRYRIDGNWSLNSSLGLNYHFADWQVRDLNSGAAGRGRTAKAVLPRIDAMNRALSSLTRPCGPPSPAKTRERESRSACGRFMGSGQLRCIYDTAGDRLQLLNIKPWIAS